MANRGRPRKSEIRHPKNLKRPDLATRVMLEDCPCDDCSLREFCATSGWECRAFNAFVHHGDRWRKKAGPSARGDFSRPKERRGRKPKDRRDAA